MKKIIIGVLVGMAIGAAAAVAWDPSYISVEELWNKVFDSTNNCIKVEGI